MKWCDKPKARVKLSDHLRNEQRDQNESCAQAALTRQMNLYAQGIKGMAQEAFKNWLLLATTRYSRPTAMCPLLFCPSTRSKYHIQDFYLEIVSDCASKITGDRATSKGTGNGEGIRECKKKARKTSSRKVQRYNGFGNGTVRVSYYFSKFSQLSLLWLWFLSSIIRDSDFFQHAES